MTFALFLTIISFLALVFWAIQRKLYPLQQQERTSRRLFDEGVRAEAKLLNMHQTGLYVNNLPQVKLQMQVQPEQGRNFVTEAHEVLSFVDLSRLHVGSTLVVRYNPANTKEIMIVRR
jgi:hypothetical protein